MTSALPSNPSLENLKKRAKALKKAWQAGAADALDRLRRVHPRYANATEQEFQRAEPRLTDCQLVLAREAGFESWRQLKVAIESARTDLPDQFVALACLCYNDPHYDHRSFHARAHEMLRQNPWLAAANIWSAATTGNASAVAAFLDHDPRLVNRPGPYGWAPLICACYSRVEPLDRAHSTFDVAKVLLERGADANAHVLKSYYGTLRFSALTGLFGGGDTGLANQPRHPRWRELAALLLAHGADPADATAIEITQDRHGYTQQKLALLLEHGLSPVARTSHPNADPAIGTITLMGLALGLAVQMGDAESVKLLLARDARTDERFDGKTPWQRAMERGDSTLARMLEEAGAPTAPLGDIERFVSLCLMGDEHGAREMLARAPELLERAPKDLIIRAVSTGREQPLKIVLDLGFDPNWQDESAAIHESHMLAENEALLRLLLEHGASLKLRDPSYDGTAIEWADFFADRELRDRLLNERDICLFDALDYGRLDRVADILERDPAALERPFAECLSREPKPEDWQTPLVRMVARGATKAVRVLLTHGADVTARHPNGRSLLALARDKDCGEIANLLEQHGAHESACL